MTLLRGAAIAACLVVAGLAAAITHTPVAYAHANLASAQPAPDSVLDEAPTRVAIWFTEPIEPGLSDIRVLDAAGARGWTTETASSTATTRRPCPWG